MIFNFIRAPKEPDPMPSRPFPTLVLLTLLALPAAHPAAAEDDAALAERDRIEALERKVELLTDELARTRQDIGVPEDEPLESAWGLGPAASKVYGIGKGLSIGGYAEALYTNVVDDKRKSGDVNRFDMLRTVLYAGYKFTDHIVFNTELEFEHATTSSTESAGSGSVSVEFATLDFLLRDEINARAGLMLVPMGFLNKMHEPPFYYGTHRPDVEQLIIPSTWRENGAGLFGDAGPVSWRAYVLTGFDASGFSAASGLRGGRQKGAQAIAEDLALAARLDWTIRPGLQLGFSAYLGDSGQGAVTPSGTEIDGRVTLCEAHAEWKRAGFDLRALWSGVEVDDAAEINELNGLTGMSSVGSELGGWYAQAGFDVLSHLPTRQELVPFVRWSELDTQQEVPDGWSRNPANDREILTVGVVYRPHPQVAIKVDWQDVDNAAGTGVDQWNLGLGYSF
jgi:hypothetical protein